MGAVQRTRNTVPKEITTIDAERARLSLSDTPLQKTRVAAAETILPVGSTPEATGHDIVSWQYIANDFAGGQQARTVMAPSCHP